MFTLITSLAKRILTPWRSSLPGLLGSSVKPSGHFQKSASELRAAKGMKISGERLEVPDVICPTPASVCWSVITKPIFGPGTAECCSGDPDHRCMLSMG